MPKLIPIQGVTVLKILSDKIYEVTHFGPFDAQ